MVGYVDTHDNMKNFDQKFAGRDAGPYIGTVKFTNDPTRQGRLGVNIPDLTLTNDPTPDDCIWCNYLSPFYGAKSIEATSDVMDYKSTQHSYGFWAIPPDIDTEVLVIFAKGEANRRNAFWIGCVQQPLTNQQVPGYGASTDSGWNTEGYDNAEGYDKEGNFIGEGFATSKTQKYGTDFLPVGEKNRRMIEGAKSASFANSIRHPVNDILAEQLVGQGLIKDDIRGTTSSSARREAPSQVFGISTPGRIRADSRTCNIGVGGTPIKPDRMPGHSFVMDDGDTIGKNQLTRLRTASGHQLLMHDTEGVVYIANGSGNAYIEMTRDGRIDVYSGVGGINLRTEGDFNLHSDANINMSAGQSIRMSATGQEPVLYTEEDIKNLDDDPFSAGHTAKVGDVKVKESPGAIIQSADYMLTLGDKGVMTSSQNGSIMDYGWAGISSYSPTNQMHGAGGQIHLAASQVHFNSTSPSGDWGPGWMTKDEVGMEPSEEGDVELVQKGVKPLESFTRETKTTVHRLVTHEPMFRASVIAGDGVTPIDHDDKKAWSKLANTPGTAEHLNMLLRLDPKSSIRDAIYQADALGHVKREMGNSTNAQKAKKILNDFGSKYNEIYGISKKINLPFDIKDSISEKLKAVKNISTIKNNLTKTVSSQVIESLSNKNIKLFKDNVFVNSSGKLFSLDSAVSGLTKNLSSIKNIKSSLGNLNSITQNFSTIVGGKIVGINQVKSLVTKSFSKVGLFDARSAAIGGQTMMQNVTANLSSKIGSIAGKVGSFFSKWSDIRLKEDIQLIGKSQSGINIYRFKYKHTNGIYEGVMAQEVPWARKMTDTGFYMVDYNKVDVEFRRLN